MDKAIAIFSGGQDSTTCLGWALKHFEDVEAITFDYGQRHKVEIEQSKKICELLGVEQTIVSLDFLPTLVTSALTGSGDVCDKHVDHADLPASFVPNRNALFLTLAHAYAQKKHASALVIGANQTDYSGYPDCRSEFIMRLVVALNLGSNSQIDVVAPLLNLSKAETFKLAEEYDVLEIVLEESHTCYEGDRSKNVWGAGCGECPACLLRKNGYENFLRGKEHGQF